MPEKNKLITYLFVLSIENVLIYILYNIVY